MANRNFLGSFINIIALLLCQLASSIALADFNGTWLGEGRLHYTNGQSEKCQMSILIEQTTEYLFVKKSLFKCENLKIESKNPQPLQILNGEIWRNEVRIGKITETLIQTLLKSPDGRQQSYRLQLETPVKMQYQDDVEWTSTYKTAISGTLLRQD
jgi:hypothetical protein